MVLGVQCRVGLVVKLSAPGVGRILPLPSWAASAAEDMSFWAVRHCTCGVGAAAPPESWGCPWGDGGGRALWPEGQAPSSLPFGIPPVQKMVALGQGPRAAAGEELQTLWLCAAHLLGPRLWTLPR